MTTEELKESGDKLNAVIDSACDILAAHLPPDGPSEFDTINSLLELLDGPRQRDAQNAWRVACR